MTPAELPYGTLFRALDGRKTLKNTFEGPIGQMLAGPVHKLPLAEFQPLTSTELPAAGRGGEVAQLRYEAALSVRQVRHNWR